MILGKAWFFNHKPAINWYNRNSLIWNFDEEKVVQKIVTVKLQTQSLTIYYLDL